MPFGMSVILGLVGMVYFPFFIEAVVVFLISDLFFGTSEVKFFDITIVATIIPLSALYLSNY